MTNRATGKRRRSRARGQYFSGRHRPDSVSRSSPATGRATSFFPSPFGPLHRYLRPRQYHPPVCLLSATTACYSPLFPARPFVRTAQAAPPHRVGYLAARGGMRCWITFTYVVRCVGYTPHARLARSVRVVNSLSRFFLLVASRRLAARR